MVAFDGAMDKGPQRKKPPANRLTFEIGRRLAARRNELGLTQGAVGRMAAVSQQQVGKYESGEDRVPADQLFRILQALNFKASALYETLDTIGIERVGFAEDSPAEFVLEAFSDRDTATLVRDFQSIHDPEQRKMVLSLASSMANLSRASDKAQPRPRKRTKT